MLQLLRVFLMGDDFIMVCFDALTKNIQNSLCISCHAVHTGITSTTVAIKLLRFAELM